MDKGTIYFRKVICSKIMTQKSMFFLQKIAFQNYCQEQL